jgi:hypothetical protein|tara:strand:- start:1595 stop:2515 length:921 start_codon:yes stop_codon:yes gene_type:complete
MKNINRILFFVLFVIFFHAAEVNAQTRVIITGEDSDKNSIERNSEIFKRVISQLQESMSRSNYYVIDEDMLGVKLGFSFNSRRPKTELIETLMVANQTEDATVQSRLAIVFAIFPQVKELSAIRKLEVRIRGDVYDLETLRPLANFEYKPKKAYLIPKSSSQCDALCVEEALGEKSRVVARELGDVLVKKLNLAVEKIGGSSQTSTDTSSGSSSVSMPKTYNLNLIRINAIQSIQFKKALENSGEMKSVKLLSRGESSRKMAIETASGLGRIEEIIIESLMNIDSIDINNIRLEMSGSDIEVENLG